MLKIKYGKQHVTFPKGFKASASFAGIAKNKMLDVGLLLSDDPCETAGVFTKNQFIAAPIKYSQNLISKKKKISAILVNSGNANAGCGSYGKEVVQESINSLAKVLQLNKSEILTFSTGSIGVPLDSLKLTTSFPSLVKGLSYKKGKSFSNSILTTDAFSKNISAEFKCTNGNVKIGVSAKGAGMISPSMATMLCFITTDADISQELLKIALKEANDASFNRISVDGDMSTNDSVIILANGASKVKIRKKNSKEYLAFKEALISICVIIAKKIVADGEGASKIVKVNVKGAKTKKDAMLVANSLSNSLLLKCAMYGEQPSWGRILSSLGSTNAKINMKKHKISLQGICCYQNGEPVFSAAKKIKPKMKSKQIDILVDLGFAKFDYHMYFSDIGYGYIDINIK